MAIRFSDTELFKNRVYFQELQQVIKKNNLSLPSPYKITNESFIKLYNLGTR